MEAPVLGYVLSPMAQFLSPPWTRAQGINWCYIPHELPCFREGLPTTSGAGVPTPAPLPGIAHASPVVDLSEKGRCLGSRRGGGGGVPLWWEISEDEGGYRRCGVRWEHLVDKVGTVPVGLRSGAWGQKGIKEGS